jgi:nucleotide-binding universal stress UspA family protein
VLVHKGEVGAYRRILVAFDLSGTSVLALQTAVAWAEVLGSEVSLVHVFEPPDYVFPEALTRTREKEHALLETALHAIGQGALLKTASLVEGEPVTGIARAAKRVDADLVVLGSHGRTGISRLLLGSVAERVLEEEQTSVLVVRGRP